jgi:hypothetical protein
MRLKIRNDQSRQIRRMWRLILALGAIWLGTTISRGAPIERLWLDAKINGKRVNLCFDSGARDLVLWRQSVQRLGISFTEPDTNAVLAAGTVPEGLTENCTLSLLGQEVNTQFGVLNLPDQFGSSCDGVVGWQNLGKNILQIDAVAGQMTILREVPQKALNWTRVSIVTNSSTLRLKTTRENGTESIILVDTGSEYGLSLSPERWKEWKEGHPDGAITFNIFYMPAEGVVAMEEAWADRFSAGSLLLTDVPVGQATRTEILLGGKQCDAALGLAALKRLDFIVDGKRGVAYLRPKTTRATPYRHNRSGVVFLPDNSRPDEFVALVGDGSPAYEAGIRTGDVVLEMDEINHTEMSDIRVMNRLWMSAGRKVIIKIRRDGKIFPTTVILRDILVPSPRTKKKSA